MVSCFVKMIYVNYKLQLLKKFTCRVSLNYFPTVCLPSSRATKKNSPRSGEIFFDIFRLWTSMRFGAEIWPSGEAGRPQNRGVFVWWCFLDIGTVFFVWFWCAFFSNSVVLPWFRGLGPYFLGFGPSWTRDFLTSGPAHSGVISECARHNFWCGIRCCVLNFVVLHNFCCVILFLIFKIYFLLGLNFILFLIIFVS